MNIRISTVKEFNNYLEIAHEIKLYSPVMQCWVSVNKHEVKLMHRITVTNLRHYEVLFELNTLWVSSVKYANS